MNLLRATRHLVHAALLALAFTPASHASDLVPPAWKNVDLRGMGYVTGIVEHPSPGGPRYVRTDVAGAFRWDAAGSRWIDLIGELPDFYQDVVNIDSLALDPSNVNRVFAAFGAYVEDGVGFDGILRSDDQGDSWTLTRFPSTVPSGGNNWWRHAGERLAVDPRNGDIVYFGSRQDGLWVSVNAGMDWAPVANLPLGDHGGVFRNDKPVNGGISFVVIDPATTVTLDGRTRSSTVYLGIMGVGIHRSTDGGATFQPMPDQPSTTINPIQARLASDGTLYVVLSADFNTSGGGAVWRWRGGSWTVVTPPNAGFTYGARDWCGIAVDPTNSDRIAVNSMNATPRDTFLSTDAGATWTILTSDPAGPFPPGRHRSVNFKTPAWWGGNAHLFTWAGGLAFSRDNPAQLWVTTGYGVYRYGNVNTSPIEANATDFMRGLEELVVTRVLPLPAATGGGVFVGAVDKAGFVIRDPEIVPTRNLGTDPIINGTGLGVSMGTNGLVASLSKWDRSSGQVWHSADGGANWTRMTTPMALKPDGTPATPWGYFAVGGDIAISSTDTNRVVWIPLNPSWWQSNRPPMFSTDSGQTWTLCSGIPQTFDGLTNVYNGDSNVLVADPIEGNTFYAYHQKSFDWTGDLYRSTDGGATWTLRSRVLDFFWKSSLVVNPAVQGEIWYSTPYGTLRRSTNGGDTFTPIPGWTALNGLGFGAPLPGRTNPTVYAVGVRGGVRSLFYSIDHGATWIDPGLGSPVAYSEVRSVSGDLARPGRVFLATDGRGIFYADLLPTGPKLGSITRDVWTNITGTSVGLVPVATTPTSTGTLTQFEAPSRFGENYGQRVRGFLHPTESGNYTFWITGDDGVALWLSPSGEPAEKVLIAQNTSFTGNREWNRNASQRSVPIALEAGKAYYIEAVMKEGGGNDHLAVSWRRKNTTPPANGDGAHIIPGTVLSPWVEPNYMKNPGFEVGLSDWQVWTSATIDHIRGINGTQAVLVGSASTSTWGGVAQSLNHLKPSTTYRLRASGRKTHEAHPAPKMGVQINDGVSTTSLVATFPSTNYTEQAVTFTTPANISWIQCYLMHDGGLGGALFDEVKLTRP